VGQVLDAFKVDARDGVMMKLSIFDIFSTLTATVRKSSSSKPPDWEQRAKQFGKKAVINIGHSETFEDIQARDRREVFPFLERSLTGSERLLLDYGCGLGRFAGGLADVAQCDVVGVDTTKHLIAHAFPHPRVKYRHVQPASVPLPDKSADIIWIFGVLGCIDGETLDGTLSELKRVLRDGGLFCLTENTTENKRSGAYYRFRTCEEYKSLLTFVDLEHVHDYYDIGKGFEERFSVMIGRSTCAH